MKQLRLWVGLGALVTVLTITLLAARDVQLTTETATPGVPMAAVTQTAVPSPTGTPRASATATTTVEPAASTATSVPGATPTPLPTATPTVVTFIEPTPAPSITPTPLHPLMIDVMRQQSYPGSDIVFEETLTPGANYDRYLASYQSEGNKIYALLTVPRGERPPTGWPVIVMNHGYIPPDEYRTGETYAPHEEGFARHSYIVFTPDYRGHNRSEGIAVGGYGTPAYTIDVLNAVAAIKRFPEADPERIGMWGHSMGGQITLRAMVVSDDIKAGVIWAGVVASYADMIRNWEQRYGLALTTTREPSSLWRSWRGRLYEQYGGPAENPAFWEAISPNTYLGDLSGPIQLHHGTADEIVPVAYSENLYEAMEGAGRLASLYLYEGDDHNFSQSFVPAITASIQFFDRYVKAPRP